MKTKGITNSCEETNNKRQNSVSDEKDPSVRTDALPSERINANQTII